MDDPTALAGRRCVVLLNTSVGSATGDYDEAVSPAARVLAARVPVVLSTRWAVSNVAIAEVLNHVDPWSAHSAGMLQAAQNSMIRRRFALSDWAAMTCNGYGYGDDSTLQW